MMATINPLGERARGNRWWRTAAAFTVGCLMGGWALGAVAGALGLLVAMVTIEPAGGAVVVAAALAFTAGVAELTARPVPTMTRQVDEAWLGRYRGWVYGAGFGLQLGAGLATTVTTVSVYATVGMAVLLGSAGRIGWALVVGAVFGLARACPVMAAGTLHDPTHLRRRAARVAAAGAGSRLAAGFSLCTLAAWAMAGR